jgi:hypothetical protein
MFHYGAKSPEVSLMSRCIPNIERIAAGKAEEAMTDLLREMANDPSYKGGLYVLSLAYKALGYDLLAVATSKLYLEMDPEGYWAGNAHAKLVEWGADALR